MPVVHTPSKRVPDCWTARYYPETGPYKAIRCRGKKAAWFELLDNAGERSASDLADVPFAIYMDWFLEHQGERGLTPGTIAKYGIHLDRCRHALGHKRIGTLIQQDFSTFFEAVAKQLPRSFAEHVKLPIRVMIHAAIRGCIDHNPAWEARTSIPKAGDGGRSPAIEMEEEHVELLLLEANPWDGAMMALMLDTYARTVEAAHLRWPDILFADRKIFLPSSPIPATATTPEFRPGRWADMSDRLTNALIRLKICRTWQAGDSVFFDEERSTNLAARTHKFAIMFRYLQSRCGLSIPESVVAKEAAARGEPPPGSADGSDQVIKKKWYGPPLGTYTPEDLRDHGGIAMCLDPNLNALDRRDRLGFKEVGAVKRRYGAYAVDPRKSSFLTGLSEMIGRHA